MKKIKQKLSDMITTYPEDKQKHYILVKYLLLPTTFVSAFSPALALGIIAVILLVAFVWELPQLIRFKWSKPALLEAQQDFLMAVFAVAFVGVQLVFRMTGADNLEDTASGKGLSTTAIVGISLAAITALIIVYKFIKLNFFNKK